MGLTLLSVMLENVAHDIKYGNVNIKAQIFVKEMVDVLKYTVLPSLQEFIYDKSCKALNLQVQ